jgi:1-acyl-sn-glycerol-3-phosphate acyltransferase
MVTQWAKAFLYKQLHILLLRILLKFSIQRMIDFRYITYDLAVCLFNFIISLFFREVRPRGSHRIPKTGPVIFVVAPHANQVHFKINSYTITG